MRNSAIKSALTLILSILLFHLLYADGEIRFGLDVDPKLSNLYKEDSLNLLLDLKTTSNPTVVDVYFVLLDPSETLFFGLGWGAIPMPTLRNITLPPDITMSDAFLLNITVPSAKPPVGAEGAYIFAVGAAIPGTFQFTPHIAAKRLMVFDGSRPRAGEVRMFDGVEFVYIPPGSFNMGSENGFFDEVPVHRVNITRGFWMSMYEITQSEWVSVMDYNPSHFTGDDLPVELVSWFEVQYYIAKKNALGNGVYRMPTEAEWEYACRGGIATEYFFGEDDTELDDYCWWWENAEEHSHPVGLKKPNPWGLYDILGNVWEWCNDYYGEYYYSVSPEDDPQGPEEWHTDRITRGCSFFGDSNTFDVRPAVRCQDSPIDTFPNLGFRLVRNE